ncbi:MAG: DUF3450 domain-containing protein [Oceanococcus sp.]
MDNRVRNSLLALVLTSVTFSVSAESVKDVLKEGSAFMVAQRDSQARIDKMDSETGDTEAEYRRLLRQIEGLEAYNRQLRTQISAQDTEISRTDESIAKATEVDRQLLPLLNNMVDTYAELVAVSPPFLPAERNDRIAFLNETIDRADVTAAEKFRQVLDAYMTELAYGNTIEAYTDTIVTDDGEREVNVLRLGRIGLFFQTSDRLHTGRWNHDQGAWEDLGPEFRNGIYQAIRVANKLTAPSLLSLPLPPPQASNNRAMGNTQSDKLLAALGAAQ